MGVKGLNQLLKDKSPNAIKEFQLKNLFGRKVAIDASMCLYQFLISVRQSDGQQLTNEEGETTSHLSGIFYRTIKLVENNIKPVYVFDGKPPVLKGGELEKRYLKREKAEKDREAIKDDGSVADILKFDKRLVKVSQDQNDEAKKLLELMGIPIVDAPCEAEAQCAELARAGKVYAAASEDMDTLCYDPPYMLRHLTFAEARKIPIDQIAHKEAMEGLDLTKAEFVDLCILLGCDYCETIKGVGPVTAYKLIKEHGNLENIIKFIKESPKSKFIVPENWPFNEARKLFMDPDITPGEKIKLTWKEPDVNGLIEFMVKQKGFSEERITNGADKLKKGLKGGVQGRLDGFFTVVKNDTPKRKADDKKEKSNKRKKK
ncbi:unnamed protein product [Candida verbasci]|uniref:Flap endonuclease 1 n=1 Tax=Candida verbasci TaxID=1227364 RepID=A0A9W4XEP0_9ASCO|nr:unnamed protein product [Candida verbasci]